MYKTIENSLCVYFFTKFVKQDPDPHGSAFILPPGSGSGSAFRKAAGSGSAKNECGSTALGVDIMLLAGSVDMMYAVS